MRKQVFIINGRGGVGKDTFVDFVASFYTLVQTALQSSTSRKNETIKLLAEYNVWKFSSIDKVKEIARMIRWDGGKTEKDRKFLSDLKLLCTDYNNMPFESMREKVEAFSESDAAMLFLCIREPEEIEKARVAFNAKTILIRRNSIKQIVSNMADKNVFNYQYDIIVDNDGDLETLYNKAAYFVKDFNNDSLKMYY